MKSGFEITLYDISGKQVMKQQLSGMDEQLLNLSAMKKGAYLMKYKDGDEIKSVKKLKE